MKECDIFDIGSGGHNIKYLSLQSQHHPQNQGQNTYVAKVKVGVNVFLRAEPQKY